MITLYPLQNVTKCSHPILQRPPSALSHLYIRSLQNFARIIVTHVVGCVQTTVCYEQRYVLCQGEGQKTH